MNLQDKATVIQYRLERADATLEEARILLAQGALFGAVNRIYYAMFYSVSALALAHDFATSSHSQLRGYFNREFVKTGRIPAELGKAFGKAYDSRTLGDYADLAVFQNEQIDKMLKEAVEFVDTLKNLISEKPE
jgi:uncharacterized protein